MVSHENGDFPENSQHVPEPGLHTSARLETIPAGCQSPHALGWATHPPTAAEAQRPSGACAIYHSPLECVKPTSLSLTAEGTNEEPQGTASSREHAQRKSRRCVCAQDNQRYSRVKTCLAHGGREVWGPRTGHHPPRPPRWAPF